MSSDHMDSHAEWRRWLESLRPDDVTRVRISRRVAEQAEPLLQLRRDAAGWQSVAARWAALLAPVAAVLAIAFGTLAYRAGSGQQWMGGGVSVTLEQLVAEEPDEAFPALLTSATEPSKDHLLAATLADRPPQP